MWGDPDDYEHEWDTPGFTGDELYMQVRGLSMIEMHPELYATRLVEAKALEKYRVWMRFADGTDGIADFGDFAGRGVFAQWEDPGVWGDARLLSDGGVGIRRPDQGVGFLSRHVVFAGIGCQQRRNAVAWLCRTVLGETPGPAAARGFVGHPEFPASLNRIIAENPRSREQY